MCTVIASFFAPLHVGITNSAWCATIYRMFPKSSLLGADRVAAPLVQKRAF